MIIYCIFDQINVASGEQKRPLSKKSYRMC